MTLVDGFTFSMPDTEKIRPSIRSTTQQPGLGFPIARFVVLLSLATAMVSDLAIGPYVGKETGETALLRELLERLNPGDILLADRLYCSYFMICLLLAAKVDFVTRLHQRRTADFRRGTRLGPGDHLVAWSRPAKPDWMDHARYDQMPKSICVREVEFASPSPASAWSRWSWYYTLSDARELTRVTTWQVAPIGVGWRNSTFAPIKVTIGMDVLRLRSRRRRYREIWAGLLAYNRSGKRCWPSACKRAAHRDLWRFHRRVQRSRPAGSSYC